MKTTQASVEAGDKRRFLLSMSIEESRVRQSGRKEAYGARDSSEAWLREKHRTRGSQSIPFQVRSYGIGKEVEADSLQAGGVGSIFWVKEESILRGADRGVSSPPAPRVQPALQ